MTVLTPEGEMALEGIVEPEELETLCDLATEFSRYAASETLRDGFLPVRGGFRVGICGTAVMKEGASTNLKSLSSAAVRIAREHKGIARDLAPRLFSDGAFVNTLILSAAGRRQDYAAAGSGASALRRSGGDWAPPHGPHR